MENRILQSISSTAEERFHYFLRRYPGLSSRIPDREIASYLGITPEFFSRMKKSGSFK
jgi:CRP-like cAMP-binding protein